VRESRCGSSPPLVAGQTEFDEIVRILGDVLKDAAALMR
jgi:adenosylmethionine-8-amino-7-oxononanoate aminotransferase